MRDEREWSFKDQVKHFLKSDYPWPDAEFPLRVETVMIVLNDFLTECNARYYDNGKSPITDAEYDRLLDKLREYEHLYPQYKIKDSITKKIEIEKEHSSLATMPKFAHDTKMQSLSKVHSFEDLEKWLKRTQKKIDKTFTLKIENKYDGVAAKLIYRSGRLKHCVLRGNGYEGFDLISVLRSLYKNNEKVKGIPEYLDPDITFKSSFSSVVETFSQTANERTIYPIDLEIVGELLVMKDDLKELNNLLVSQNQAPYPTLRHAAAGLVAARSFRKLTFVAYEADRCLELTPDGDEKQAFKSVQDILEWLKTMKGFIVATAEFATIKKTDTKYQEVFDAIERISKRRPDLPFAIDGAVLKVREDKFRRSLGRGRKSPNWAIAYKFPPATASAELVRVEWNMGRSGAFSPVAIFKPVCISGVWYSRALLHNPGKVAALGLCKNDVIFIQRSGDVIPAVIGVDEATRSKRPVHIEVPTECQYCGSKLEHTPQALKCPNRQCPGKEEEMILYCTGKSVFNLRKLRSLGMDTIRELSKKGILRRPEDFFSLTTDILSANIPQPKTTSDKEWKQKLTEVIDEIHIVERNLSWEQILVSLNIPGVSVAQAKTLAGMYHLSDLPNVDFGTESAVARSVTTALTWPEIQTSLKVFKGLIMDHIFE